METKMMVMLTAIIVVALCASVAVYFLVLPHAQPLDTKAEFKMLIEKMKNMPNSKSEFELELGVPYLGSMSMSFTADVIWYVLSPEKQRVSLSMEVLGYTTDIDSYVINGKTIFCSQASGFLTQPKLQCVAKTEEDKAMFPGTSTPEFDIDKILKDYNISFAGEKEVAKRSTKCYNIEARAADLNLSSSKGLFSLADNTAKQELSEPKMPTGLATLPGSSLPKDATITLLICLDKEYGFPALVDLNFTYKQIKYAKKPITVTFTMKLKSFARDVVTEQDLEIPMPFAATLECNKKQLNISLLPFKDLSGDLHITVNKGFGILYSEETEESEKAEFETTIKNVQLKAFQQKDFNITPDKMLKSGFKDVEICIGDECQSESCHISSAPLFYPKATCESDKIEITLRPYVDFSGDVNVTLYTREYDYNLYEYKKIPILNKIFTGVSAKAYSAKVFFLEPREPLEKGSYTIEVCLDSECDTTSCYIYSWTTTEPTPETSKIPSAAFLIASCKYKDGNLEVTLRNDGTVTLNSFEFYVLNEQGDTIKVHYEDALYLEPYTLAKVIIKDLSEKPASVKVKSTDYKYLSALRSCK
jgi:hypothetical protein